MVWKDYSPSHFCGATGTFNGIDESIPGVPAREKCEPASVGEFWCAPFVSTILIKMLGWAAARVEAVLGFLPSVQNILAGKFHRCIC